MCVSLQQVQHLTRTRLAERGADLPRIKPLGPRTFLWLMKMAAVFLPQAERKKLGTLPVLLDYLGSPQVFDGSRSRDVLLAEAEIGLPEAEDYLPDIINRYFPA